MLPLLDHPDVPIAVSLQLLAHLQTISDTEHAKVIFDEGWSYRREFQRPN